MMVPLGFYSGWTYLSGSSEIREACRTCTNGIVWERAEETTVISQCNCPNGSPGWGVEISGPDTAGLMRSTAKCLGCGAVTASDSYPQGKGFQSLP